MRAFLVFLLFILGTLSVRWYYVCEIKQLCVELEEVHPEYPRPMDLTFMDGDAVILEGYEQFHFPAGSISPELTENNRDFLNKIATYLKENPDRNLTLKGFFRKSETGLTADVYENLGVARAAHIRSLLVEQGLPEANISLDYEGISNDSLPYPIQFEGYLAQSDIPEEFDKMAFTFTNMTFSDANFAFDSDEFKPGEQFILYADSVKTYLEANTDKNLLIIGHTDDVGQQSYNKDLGLRRANNAKDYFLELGLSGPVETSSLGETRPVAPNNSPANRQKNRRVNFKIE